MNICIWFRLTPNPWGGGNQFLRALAQELVKNGHRVSFTPAETADVVLVNAHNVGAGQYLSQGKVAQLRHTGTVTWWGRFIPERVWPKRRHQRPVLVHRLDGVAERLRGHRTKADELQPVINRLTDSTIFQSRYSKESFAECGVRPRHSAVIYNAVDPTIFFPAKARVLDDRTLKLIATSWSPNPRKGFATLARLSHIPGVEVRFIGQWCPTVEPANVVQLGTKVSHQIAEVLRDSDAFVHASENETCSNSMLEGLASGLPVLFHDSGGNREIAGEYGVPMTGDLVRDSALLRESHRKVRDKILDDRARFLIPHIAQQYIEAFEHTLSLSRDVD